MESFHEEEFSLKIKNSYYIQDGSQHATDIPCLTFKNNGKINGKGLDIVGEFKIKGYMEGQYLYLDKKYAESSIVYYMGKFDGEELNLVWDWMRTYDQMKETLETTKTAGIVFESEVFNLRFKKTDAVHTLALQEENNEEKHHFYGILNIDDKLRAVHFNIKDCEKCHGEIFALNYREELKGKYDRENKTFTEEIEGDNLDLNPFTNYN